MAVKIGTTTGSTGDPQITLTQTADEAAAFNESYGVGNYADGMKIAIDGNGQIYTVTSYDSGTGVLDINPPLDDNIGPSSTDVYKVYEGAHGTESTHLRKRLLGYI